MCEGTGLHTLFPASCHLSTHVSVSKLTSARMTSHPIPLSNLQLFAPAWHSLLSCGESIPVTEHQTNVKITEFFAAPAYVGFAELRSNSDVEPPTPSLLLRQTDRRLRQQRK